MHAYIWKYVWAPGVWGSGEKGYLFSGKWGALVIYFREQTHGFRDLGSPAKSKK